MTNMKSIFLGVFFLLFSQIGIAGEISIIDQFKSSTINSSNDACRQECSRQQSECLWHCANRGFPRGCDRDCVDWYQYCVNRCPST